MESLSEQVITLIFDREYDRAKAMIDAARGKISSGEAHRLTALSAVLQKEAGNIHHAIELVRSAKQEAPTWLPHLYRLSVFLMDAKQWSEALVALDELIALSERNGDLYFINDARIRKIFCLKALNRYDEIQAEKDKVPSGTTVFIDDKAYRLEDLD